MNNLDDIAQKNNYKGIAISVAIHVIIFLLFLWVTVWQEPYPPNPEYGIELNFGNVNTGNGQEPVSAEDPTEELEQEIQEEATEEAVDEESTSPANELTETEDVNSEASESQESTESIASQEEGPVEEKVVKEKEVSPVKESKKESTSKPADKQKEVVKEVPKTNPNALFPGNNSSQGESNNKEGDQGKPDGKVDAEALMGPQGGGSGSKLDMSGWAWDKPPRPNDKSDQNGQIVFRIKVDDNGEVINVEVLETTVSPDVVRVYQSEVEKLTFYKTSSGKTLNAYTGKITFLIRSR